ncbi:MAG: hypothetical protein IH804_08805 [Planctomycetes bacterium]|nr:hypothetical protein [Planctomycetota bacterium]
MGPEESETLIGRIMDHEATGNDRRRFEQLADVDPDLWRRLALDQVDMGLLAGRVREATAPADRVDVSPARGRRNLALVFSGWAAVVVLAASWAFVAGMGDQKLRYPATGLTPARQAPQVFGPQDHLREYLASDFVIGELDPVVTETEPLELEPGRHRVWYMRRIEEFVDIDTPVDAAIEGTKFKTSPEELRSGAGSSV